MTLSLVIVKPVWVVDSSLVRVFVLLLICHNQVTGHVIQAMAMAKGFECPLISIVNPENLETSTVACQLGV